jgi:hypothetical protein
MNLGLMASNHCEALKKRSPALMARLIVATPTNALSQPIIEAKPNSKEAGKSSALHQAKALRITQKRMTRRSCGFEAIQ